MKLALCRLGHSQGECLSSNQTAANDLKQTLFSWLEVASQFLVQRLITDAEPRVWYTNDAEGNLWWHAHDAVAGRSTHGLSEAEMRVWLEQRRHPVAQQPEQIDGTYAILKA